jgi:hypothetical protein
MVFGVDVQEDAESTLRYWLEYDGHALELRHGPLVIGRASECNLVLDDALVSRRHARIFVEGGKAQIEDLGSANGVRVNGERVTGQIPLQPGDRVTLGKQEMILRAQFGALLARRSPMVATIAGEVPRSAMEDSGPGHTSVKTSPTALGLLASVVDKVLAMGRGDEGERLLSTHLTRIQELCANREEITDETLDFAVVHAVKLARATKRGKWVDYVIDLYSRRGTLPAVDRVDELMQLVGKVDEVNLAALRKYLAERKVGAAALGPAERFALQRLEGIERLVAAK